MPEYRHTSGKTMTAEEGTKRYDIFERSTQWTRLDDEPEAQAESGPVHLGGGWYEVDGEKYQGKDEAEEAARKASE